MALLRTGTDPAVLRQQCPFPPQLPDTFIRVPGGHLSSNEWRASYIQAYRKHSEGFVRINGTAICSNNQGGAKRPGICIITPWLFDQYVKKEILARLNHPGAKHEGHVVLQKAKQQYK
ncbi:MAG: hypothetical protein H0T92_05175 [Pyrinomonadaceae bacterium]|nr:hypothetical protein [Pyrinomonadaceae bacterium]